MDILIQEIRHAIRSLLRAPMFTGIAVLCLTLAIGAVTTVYSVFHAVMLDPYPFNKPDQVIQIDLVHHEYDSDLDPRISMRQPQWEYFRDHQTVFDQAYFMALTTFSITGVEQPFQLTGAVTSADMPTMLGMRVEKGRLLDVEDSNRDVVLLSYRGWQANFGGAEDIVGSRVNIAGNPHEVIGVLARDHQFFVQADLLVPEHVRYDDVDDQSSIAVNIFGRLREGDSVPRLNQRLVDFSRQAVEFSPSIFNYYRYHGRTITDLNALGNTAFTMRTLLASVLALLLIATANVANLMLIRVQKQEQELAIRAAIGARRRHIVRRLMIENSLLGVSGIVFGSIAAYFLLPLLVEQMAMIPNPDRVSLNLPVFTFAVAVTILTVMLIGAVPAFRATRLSLASTLREGGNKGMTGGGATVRKTLVTAEVAIAFVLLVSAGLMFKSFYNIQNIDTGYNPERVQTMVVNVPSARASEAESVYNYYDELRAAMASLPEVEQIGFASQTPINDRTVIARMSVEDFPPENPQDVLQPYPYLHIVSPGYFRALEIPLLNGRYFDHTDREDSAPVIIINQAFVDHLWPGQNVLGKRIKRFFYDDPQYPWLEIVGVVDSLRGIDGNLQNPPPLAYYLPMRQTFSPSRSSDLRMLVKTRGEPEAALETIRKRVYELDSDTVLANELTLTELMDNSTRAQRANMFLLTLLAIIGLALAVAGIFGVISFTTQQRLREIGLRMALGARSDSIFNLVVGNALMLGGAGLTVGLLLMLSASSVIGGQLYEVDAFDTWIYGGILMAILVTVLIAAWVPAFRASRTDPALALRQE